MILLTIIGHRRAEVKKKNGFPENVDHAFSNSDLRKTIEEAIQVRSKSDG